METQRELIEGLLQFVALAESERKLLAADLHDQTLSDLRELARLARQLLRKPDACPTGEARDALGQIVLKLEAAMDEVRRIMECLSPSALDTLGFVLALESCLSRAAASCEQSFSTKFSCSVKEQEVSLSEVEQIMLYRIVQEALNNISRHAGACKVGLEIARADGELFIRVTDDGCGLTASGDLRRARGLENMRYRARLIGAHLALRALAGGQGTVVEVRMPMKAF